MRLWRQGAGSLIQSSRQVAWLRSPRAYAKTCRVRRQSANQSQDCAALCRTNDHNSSISMMSPFWAGRRVSSRETSSSFFFRQPGVECVPTDAKRTGDTSHGRAFLVGFEHHGSELGRVSRGSGTQAERLVARGALIALVTAPVLARAAHGFTFIAMGTRDHDLLRRNL